jgi:hypothetical protein
VTFCLGHRNALNHPEDWPSCNEMTMAEFIHGETTIQIIGAAIEVRKVLGYGFLEKAYENVLVEELRSRNLDLRQQMGLEVWYKGIRVGEYVADLFVAGVVAVVLLQPISHQSGFPLSRE